MHKNFHNYYACVEIRKGVCCLPQTGTLAKELLEKRLTKAGNYEIPTTPGHKWHPIMLYITVDDFGVQNAGKEHVEHLILMLEENYEIIAD